MDESMAASVPADSGINAEAEQTATPEAAVQAEETPQTANQGQSTEDSFFDPTAIPEELKPAYKQMQAAFTKKTQEIAQARKEADAVRQQAESYAKYEQYVPILEEMLSSQKPTTTIPNAEMIQLEQQLKGAGYSEEAIEMMKMSATWMLNQVNQTLSSKDQQQAQAREAQVLTTNIAEAGKLDPRLNDATLTYTSDDGQTRTFGQIVEALVAATPEWQKDVVKSTRDAIKMVDAMMGTAKAKGKEELSQSAKAKANKFPQTTSSPQGAADTNQAMSFSEAAAMARAELGLSK